MKEIRIEKDWYRKFKGDWQWYDGKIWVSVAADRILPFLERIDKAERVLKRIIDKYDNPTQFECAKWAKAYFTQLRRSNRRS